MTIREAQSEAARNIDARDAQRLLMHLLARDRAWLLAHGNDELYADTLLHFRSLVRRRAAREPLQYLTGTQEFYGLALRVTPAALIPRPETEGLVEAAQLWLSDRNTDRVLEVADVGTGSGAIAIAIATHVADVRVTAIDTSLPALELARENARTHQCESRIEFLQNDLLSGIAAHTFDAVISNPPYVPAGDSATMQPEVVAHEPQGALFAGDDGLDIYRRLIPQAHHALKPHGLLAMEFGFGQSGALAALLAEGWENVRFQDDLAGIPRIVHAERA
jgi:release factor glutamine methyltransferase